ncbi:MAG: lysophospholipase [Clostridiales bacterium]|nr:lysophospholipase [Candidatus Cacconaster stercorequi]
MTKITEFTFLSTDGKTALHGVTWLPSDRETVAVLQISHGVAEYILRYDAFARYLNEQGIAVVGHDHLGHGGSIPAGGIPVYFGHGNTWETVVDDIHALRQRIAQEYPDLPVFLLGHSMGSFLARSYLIRYPSTVRGAIIMGTGWQPEAIISGGLTMAKLIARRKGDSGTSKLVTSLAFGSYNKAFTPVRTPYDWLSADTDNVDRYIADPLCGNDATVGLFRQMLLGFRFNQKKSQLARMDKRTPIFFVSGQMDPVGEQGKGVRRSCEAFRNAGVTDLALRLYPGLRHEILNEASQQSRVFQDIYQWMAAYI